MNILLVINENYVNLLVVLLKSLVKSNPNEKFNVYVLYRKLSFDAINKMKGTSFNNISINLVEIGESEIDKFPVYEKRYPVEIYIRLFATRYLPNDIDKILYLDTDIVVINSLRSLYDMDFDGNYFIATTHVRKMLHKFHELRLKIDKESVYINTGVLLMNLKELRRENVVSKVLNFVEKNRYNLMLPDQDILSALYGSRVKVVDDKVYNLGDRNYNLYNLQHIDKPIDIKWVRKNTVIVHYYGKNKPWNDNYKGELGIFYKEVVSDLKNE